MKKAFFFVCMAFHVSITFAQNVGVGTIAPQAYGHGGNNRVLEVQNDAGPGSDIQSHLILSTNGTNGSLGTVTWASQNASGFEKRTAIIANVFESANSTRLAFYTRTVAGAITEKMAINANGNVGIGISTANFPLSFSNSLGDKISLYGTSANHYGFGIQGALLQIHTDGALSNIAFGYGSSGSFTERMRILNDVGYDGMILNGRLILKNGSADLVGGGTGVWLYKADNSALLGLMGAQNNQNIGFYGGPSGWGFTYNALNSRVGIGNQNPNAPLAFAPSLGKKITLYPGATGDVGFGVASNRLQIFSDNPFADVAIGYDAAGTFNERFAVKPTGALAVSGNTGTPGQILSSDGNSATAQWVSMGSAMPVISTESQIDISSNGGSSFFPGAVMNISLTETNKLLLFCDVTTTKAGCIIGDCPTSWVLTINPDNAGPAGIISCNFNPTVSGATCCFRDRRAVGPFVLTLAPGNHTITFSSYVNYGASLSLLIKPTAILLKQ